MPNTRKRRRDQRGGDRPADERGRRCSRRRAPLAAAGAALAGRAHRRAPGRFSDIWPSVTTRLAGRQAALDHRDRALRSSATVTGRVDRPCSSAPDQVDEGALRALVHRRRRHGRCAWASVCSVRLHVDELARPQLRARRSRSAPSAATVPVAGSTWLSATDSSPAPRSAPVSWLSAWSPAACEAVRRASTSRWKSPCGTVKVTAIGSIWLTLTMPVVDRWSRPCCRDRPGARRRGRRPARRSGSSAR